MVKTQEQKRVSATHRTDGKSPIDMITAERQSQPATGYDAAHDDHHSAAELAAAGAYFALGSTQVKNSIYRLQEPVWRGGSFLPIASDRFDIRCVDLWLHLALRICLGFA